MTCFNLSMDVVYESSEGYADKVLKLTNDGLQLWTRQGLKELDIPFKSISSFTFPTVERNSVIFSYRQLMGVNLTLKLIGKVAEIDLLRFHFSEVILDHKKFSSIPMFMSYTFAIFRNGYQFSSLRFPEDHFHTILLLFVQSASVFLMFCFAPEYFYDSIIASKGLEKEILQISSLRYSYLAFWYKYWCFCYGLIFGSMIFIAWVMKRLCLKKPAIFRIGISVVMMALLICCSVLLFLIIIDAMVLMKSGYNIYSPTALIIAMGENMLFDGLGLRWNHIIAMMVLFLTINLYQFFLCRVAYCLYFRLSSSKRKLYFSLFFAVFLLLTMNLSPRLHTVDQNNEDLDLHLLAQVEPYWRDKVEEGKIDFSNFYSGVNSMQDLLVGMFCFNL